MTKFYDLQVPLRPVNSKSYLAFNGISETTAYYDVVAVEVANSYRMTMRDISRYSASLDKNKDLIHDTDSRASGNCIIAFVAAGLVPALLAMKISDPKGYSNIKNSHDVTYLYGLLQRSESLIKFLDSTWGSFSDFVGSDVITEDIRKEKRVLFLNLLIHKIYSHGIKDDKVLEFEKHFGRTWGIEYLEGILEGI